MLDLLVVGGGAAGFFGAIQLAEHLTGAKIVILEKSKKVLSKVKVSGGGRCNVTHACFEPAALASHYPRGEKELLGPFHRFACGDMLEWLANHGVECITEKDGRIFPASHTSQTIIDCFLKCCDHFNIEIRTMESVDVLRCNEQGHWVVSTQTQKYSSRNVLFTTGSSPSSWRLLQSLGHHIISGVPSLFTFNCHDPLIQDLPGIVLPSAELTIPSVKLEMQGPVLITHWGLSGPAVLKMSAWGARRLYELDYQFSLQCNWAGSSWPDLVRKIQDLKLHRASEKLSNSKWLDIPKRFYHRLLEISGLSHRRWADLSKKDIHNLANYLTRYPIQVTGKSTFKEEFVTAGGVNLKEINLKTFESKLLSGLYLAGEVLNIDAITGGFNFQAAWTGSYLAARSMALQLNQPEEVPDPGQ